MNAVVEEEEVEEEEARVAEVAEAGDVATTTTEMTISKIEVIEEVAVNDQILEARDQSVPKHPSRNNNSLHSNRTLQSQLRSSNRGQRRFPKYSSNPSTTWLSL